MAFFLVDKGRGITSFDVVAQLRKKLNTKRVGHTGTLDPLASGLLLVATNTSTKLIEYCMGHTKKYQSVFRLDGWSETDDMEGPIHTLENISPPSLQAVQDILKQEYSGSIYQLPPQYSAIKLNGKRAYDIARNGGESALVSRKVTIVDSAILSYEFPRLELTLTVSSGTYIRSIARDLGKALTGGGYVESLRRTKIDHLSVTDPVCFPIPGQTGEIQAMSYTDIFPDIPFLQIAEKDVVHNLFLGKKGQRISSASIGAGKYFLTYEDDSIGLIEVSETGEIRVLKNNV